MLWSQYDTFMIQKLLYHNDTILDLFTCNKNYSSKRRISVHLFLDCLVIIYIKLKKLPKLGAL